MRYKETSAETMRSGYVDNCAHNFVRVQSIDSQPILANIRDLRGLRLRV